MNTKPFGGINLIANLLILGVDWVINLFGRKNEDAKAHIGDSSYKLNSNKHTI